MSVSVLYAARPSAPWATAGDMVEAAPLATARLKMRMPTMADAGQITLLAHDAAVAHNALDMPYPYGLTDAERFIVRAQKDRAHKAPFLITAHDGTPLGCVAVNRATTSAFDLSIWIGKRHWGRGYASEAIEAIIPWAARALGAQIFNAGHAIDNPAAAALLIKTGFLYTGVMDSQISPVTGTHRPVRAMMRFA